MATDKTKKPSAATAPDDSTTTESKARAKNQLAKAAKGEGKSNRSAGGKSTMKRGESKHSERRIVAVEDQAKALEYRKMGLSYSQIAEKLGMGSPQTAWNAVESALQRVLQEPADAVRTMELQRLDALFIVPYGNALRGDAFALGSCLSIMARRAKLLGIDAPVVAHTKDIGPPQVGGVLVVGSTMSPEEWATVAKAQQAKLTTDTAEIK